MVLPLFKISVIRGSHTGDSFNIMLEFDDDYISSDSVSILGSSLNILGSKLKKCALNLNFFSKKELKVFERFVQTYNANFDVAVAFKEFAAASKLKDVKQRTAAVNALNEKYFSSLIGRTVGAVIV